MQHAGSHDIERWLFPLSAGWSLRWRACCRTLCCPVRRRAPLKQRHESNELFTIHTCSVLAFCHMRITSDPRPSTQNGNSIPASVTFHWLVRPAAMVVFAPVYSLQTLAFLTKICFDDLRLDKASPPLREHTMPDASIALI
jgi:hypothetical protein